MTAELSDADLLARVEELCEQFPPSSVPAREFWSAQFDRGLAWPSFPVGLGGLGVSSRQQWFIAAALKERRSPANIPDNPVGVGMVAPVLVTLGSTRQQARYLRPTFIGDEIWCQLFSEPGAGSDLAGLATTAVRDGDEWVVTGQKVWTTFAHRARWGLLIARTDVDVPKHRGLTCLVVDMQAPGVEVRPLRQIDGDREFNEVFLNEVRVRDSDRIGEVGDGWKIALATLMNERVALSERLGSAGGASIGRALSEWNQATDRPEFLRQRLLQLYIESECLRVTKLRAASARRRGTPGPEDSVGKVLGGELSQRLAEFCLDLTGLDGMLIAGYEPPAVEPGTAKPDAARVYLRSKSHTIAGGTTEILKNIIAERVLGLPPESRADKELPWRDVPRG